MDGALFDLERTIPDGLAPVVVRRFEETSARIVRDALERWPRKTGRSAAAFRILSRLTPDGIETVLYNDARDASGRPYAYMIKFSRYTEAELRARAKSSAQLRYLQRKFGKGAPSDALTYKSPWQVLVRSPHRKAQPKLADELQDELIRLADGGS